MPPDTHAPVSANAGKIDRAGPIAQAVTDLSVAFSIVIPMRDEIGSVRSLLDTCAKSARPLGRFEFCVTDDGSTDGTADALQTWAFENPDSPVRVLQHKTSAGQSAAVHSAVKAAAGTIIVTLDGDGQNPPDQIGKVLAPLLGAAPARLGLVAGQRVGRDDPWAKRRASQFANGLRGWILGDNTRDTGCGLKAFRRDAFLALPYFDHMHRFLPALFARDGWEVSHVEVTHRRRETGVSKYNNLQRGVVGITDLMGVAWLIRRRKTTVPVVLRPNQEGGAE